MNRANKLVINMRLAILAIALLINGCGPTPTPTLPGEHLEWDKIVSTDFSSGYKETTPTIRIVTAADQVPEFEGLLLPPHLKPVRDTDFDTHIVVAVFQGKKMTTGYSIEVTDVRLDGKSIAIYAKFLPPATGEVVGGAITSPYYMLRVKKTPDLRGDLTFVLIANEKEIVRHSQLVP